VLAAQPSFQSQLALLLKHPAFQATLAIFIFLLMTLPSFFSHVQALVFDLMGTCTDWHTSITAAMGGHPIPPPLTEADLPALASEWRAGFFRAIIASFNAGEESPDIDIVHAQVFDELLEARGVSADSVWDTKRRGGLVQAWHSQKRKSNEYNISYSYCLHVIMYIAWPDSIEGLTRLKDRFMM
jgi:hypothetical protein